MKATLGYIRPEELKAFLLHVPTMSKYLRPKKKDKNITSIPDLCTLTYFQDMTFA